MGSDTPTYKPFKVAPPAKTVYLAGPITGLTYGEARYDWRERFSLYLPQHVLPMSPMRVVGEMMPEQGLTDMPEAEGVRAMQVNRAILVRDEADLRAADAIVACVLGAKRVSIGTVAEMAMAHMIRKPLVLVMEEHGNCHEHPFVTSFGAIRTSTLKEAADVVTHLLTPGI